MSKTNWLFNHPRVIVNILAILLLIGYVTYLAIRPIDVLKDWTLETSKPVKIVNGKKVLPVYHPGDSLEFKSQSTKLTDDKGETTRIFDCDATKTAPAREIQIDKLVANRGAGYNAPKENSITVPDVTEFNGLPRTCRLIITINYTVFPARNHPEVARSNDFLVENQSLQQQINDLKNQLKSLQNRLAQQESQTIVMNPSQSQTITNQTTNNQTSTKPTKPEQPSESAEQPSLIQTILQPFTDLTKQLGL